MLIIARTLLLNIEIDDKKEPVFLWKEPFNTLIKSLNVNNGATEYTNFEHICKHVAYWIYDNAGYTMDRIFDAQNRDDYYYKEPNYEY